MVEIGRSCYKDFKNVEIIKNGVRTDLLWTLESLNKILAMVVFKISAEGLKMTKIWLLLCLFKHLITKFYHTMVKITFMPLNFILFTLLP